MIRQARLIPFALLLLVSAAGCRQQAPAKEYPLKGQIVGINRETRQLAVKHDDIPGLMPGMIMSFDVADGAEIDRRAVGELITATLVVKEFGAQLRDITVTGRAPVEQAVTRQSTTPVLQPGDVVPDAAFTDQDGRERRIAEWRGGPLLLTFIYTRCPLPDFCPRLERNFLELQSRLAAQPASGRTRLVAITFDPRYDTPAVLKQRADAIGANPEIWTYLTGDVEHVETFAARFGVSIIRNPADAKDITHNLRTAIVSADGTLVEVLNGSDWKTEDALDALRRKGAKGN